MLALREVRENEFRFYKTETPVPPGTYYATRQRFSPHQKLCFSPIAATSEEVPFIWLLPPERWIKVYFDEFTPPETALYGQVDTANPQSQQALSEALSIKEATIKSAREWQRTFLADGYIALERTGQYRRAAVAPLGAGKTLGGLLVGQLPVHGETLVLAPRYLHDEWKGEARKWGLPVPQCSTYESAYRWLGKRPQKIILDEVLHVKNERAKRSAETKALTETAKVVVGLTGTPTSVSPMDLRWLNSVFAGAVPSNEKNWKFLWGADTALKEVKEGQSAYITTKWNTEEISKFTAPYIMTVDVSAIRAELPEFSKRVIYTPQPAMYEGILTGCATEASKAKAITQARQAADGFIEDDLGNIIELDHHKIEVIADFVETNDEPIIVFANWRPSINRLCQRLQYMEPARVEGGADYGAEIERFKSGKTRLLVANSRIAEGMNLQDNCRIEIFMSLCNQPVKLQQAKGRIYRPGQKRACQFIYVLAKDTLDEKALELLENHTSESEEFVESSLHREFERQQDQARGHV